MHSDATLCQFLKDNGIPYERFDHPPVFTCEEAAELRQPMPGTDTKNLFLRDKKGKRHLLVTVGHEKRVSIRDLETVVDAKALSFASPDRLKTHLGVEPGSVTMLGLINDADHAVEFYVDRAVWESDTICCHPLVNTATLAVPRAGLETMFRLTGHEIHVIDVPGL